MSSIHTPSPCVAQSLAYEIETSTFALPKLERSTAHSSQPGASGCRVPARARAVGALVALEPGVELKPPFGTGLAGVLLVIPATGNDPVVLSDRVARRTRSPSWAPCRTR